ncbi:MAG: alpha/beta fold hydrolase [Acidimicrobiales bacterium]
MSGPERNLSMWRYHLRQLDDLAPVADPRSEVHDAPSLAVWQGGFRRELVELLAPWPDDVPLLLEVADAGPADGDGGFARHRVHCRVERHLDLSAWLLVPDHLPAPGPAVLAVHGHGPDPWLYEAGADAVVGPDPTDLEAMLALRAQCPPFGAELARAGFVVLAPDLRGFGARSDGWPSGHHLCDLELTQHLARGRLPLTGHLHDLRRCLDVLVELPEVDPNRIGAAGFSLGGTLVLHLAALDERVAAAFVSGGFSDPRAAARVPFDVCGTQVLPGMLVDVDHVGLAAAIAPRPLSIETGDRDVLWPAADAVRAGERVADIYRAVGADGACKHRTFAGDHRWDGTGLVDDLQRALASP